MKKKRGLFMALNEIVNAVAFELELGNFFDALEKAVVENLKA